jgi:cyclophilin family peptidyl-prolyl cis-trans isomerase
MFKKFLSGLLIVLVLALAGFFLLTKPTDQPNQDSETNQNSTTNQNETTVNEESASLPPEMTLDKNKKYAAILKTSAGDITVDLFSDRTPITVNNFVTLARNNFYDGTIFHRVIKGFMIQGGDPRGDGSGGPGYQFDDEPFEGEYTRGTVAMANAGPNTNGSQFFIIHQDYDLPKNYVIFGRVSEGIEVVDAIAQAPTQANSSGENSAPVNPAEIETIEIIEK